MIRTAIAAMMLALAVPAIAQEQRPFRPPAVPLVTHDPYFSVWSMSDRLTDSWPKHWTGKTMGMCGMIRIDGKTYRWCGPEPREVPAMEQEACEVTATRTTYRFREPDRHVTLRIEFLSPVLADDPDLASRPITYINVSAGSWDERPHDVQLYLDCSAEWAVNTPDQDVRWTRARAGGLGLAAFASQDQQVLKKRGDDLRIDWGSFIVATPQVPGGTDMVIGGHGRSRAAFAATGRLIESDDLRQPRPANDDWPVIAWSLGGQAWEQSLALAYDDLYSIELFGRRLRPYWARAGADLPVILAAFPGGLKELGDRCATFDRTLAEDLARVGGAKYAALAALAFRQTMAAHKIAADWDGTPLMFPKENFSNGCISTVDVIFPSSPFFLYFNPELLKAQLRPLMDYAASPRWKFPFAPHDLGTYPLANGQVYGGGEKTEDNQMPVEESGNMLIMLAAIAKVEGNPGFAAGYWPTVEKWGGYLKEHGLDPENQLCTDDFAGHLAHNANLAVKAIIGLGGYAQLCELTGRSGAAAEARAVAQKYAREWMRLADDGDHYRLAYDKPGTWSQKYNLVWDRVLGTNLFPPEVARKEMAFYRKHVNKYGLPLDNRETYAKLDFSVWTACLTGERADFEALVNPLYDFASDTRDRVPLTDWYSTVDARCIGFRARSVVGAVYMPLLLEKLKAGGGQKRE